MKKVTSKRLVIDACVARSAGEREHPTSEACRTYLKEILAICHKIVMTQEIRAEWEKHQSRFSKKWLVQMIAKKKFVPIQVNLETDLWDQAELIESEKHRAAILKDLHLIEAAIATDKIIISTDDRFYQLVDNFLQAPKIKELIWKNPCKDPFPQSF